MTKKELAVVMAYTGSVTLAGENLKYYCEYVESLLGYAPQTLDFYYLKDEIKKRAKADFIRLCKEATDE